MKLTVVGLGPGSLDDLTRKAWRVLKAASQVYLRTRHHNCVSCLPQTGATYHTFDDLYQQKDDLDAIHAEMLDTLIAAARESNVVYAVPGSPRVGEPIVSPLLQRAREEGIAVEVVDGVSFVEPVLSLVDADALDGLQILDGSMVAGMHHPPLNPALPAVIGQVYDRVMASQIKHTLLNQYPADYAVTLLHGAGMDDAGVETVTLDALDQSEVMDHMTALYVPALGAETSFEGFQEIVAHLRAPEGCPWDRKQTHESLRQYLVEEAYEVLEAIDIGDIDELYRELGDLMLQIVLHTQIAIDTGEFNMTDVLRHINEKMVRRHPHVFASTDVADANEVMNNWEAIKAQEKAEKNGNVDVFESVLDGVPNALPALLRALKYQDRAARGGFDWDEIADVRAKIIEELDEVLEAETPQDREEELGDFLFVVVNWARWLDIDPENALRLTNEKFYRRFTHVEKRVRESGKPMTEFTLQDLDAFWDEAKSLGM